jgi:hypothetical protein
VAHPNVSQDAYHAIGGVYKRNLEGVMEGTPNGPAFTKANKDYHDLAMLRDLGEAHARKQGGLGLHRIAMDTAGAAVGHAAGRPAGCRRAAGG